MKNVYFHQLLKNNFQKYKDKLILALSDNVNQKLPSEINDDKPEN